MKTMTRPGLAVLVSAAYAALQAGTSGLFAYSFYRTEKAFSRNCKPVRLALPHIRTAREQQALQPDRIPQADQ
jgi:hypothetical protein